MVESASFPTSLVARGLRGPLGYRHRHTHLAVLGLWRCGLLSLVFPTGKTFQLIRRVELVLCDLVFLQPFEAGVLSTWGVACLPPAPCGPLRLPAAPTGSLRLPAAPCGSLRLPVAPGQRASQPEGPALVPASLPAAPALFPAPCSAAR
uniref:Uncharacterized protein n=1 Tax=Rousettus aegyptiacus TaxID=9407 RepID=A0A7J8C2U9_ROUAE|nr:hypothetical protein HJG63_009477 [Rousettus aegyptiacus]